MRPSAILCCIGMAIAVPGASALELETTLALTASTQTANKAFPDLDAMVSHEGLGFTYMMDLGIDGSGDYGNILSGSFGKISPMIKEGGASWKGGPFSLALGKFELADELDSPYSLVLSSERNVALSGSFRYEDERFFVSDIWFALNYNSAGAFVKGDGSVIDTITGKPATMAWPDRSAVVKSYGLKVGDVRVGYQDIVVFSNLEYGSTQRGPLFDLEYFVNPTPSFLIQYGLDSPWKKSGSINDNAMMGFFFAWKGAKLSADGQVLVDDLNMNRFLHPADYQNPDKVAWNLGWSIDTDFGTLRFDHAGATKYTFSTSGSGGSDNLAYGYTFYPDTEFLRDDSYQAIDPEGNYAGYLHGENNLAYMVTWTRDFADLKVKADIEFTVSGAKSPANSWGPLTSFPEGSHLLDDPILEKKLVLAGSASYDWGSFRLWATAMAGYVWNRLELSAVPGEVLGAIDNGIPYYLPSNDSTPIGSLTLGGTWKLAY